MVSFVPWHKSFWLLAFTSVMSVVAHAGGGEAVEDVPLAQTVRQLVRQLDADEVASRDQAEQALLDLAPNDDAAAGEAYLLLLPAISDRMPEEVRLRLDRIRQTIATRLANRAVAATTVTLSAERRSLKDVLEQIEKQTANRLVDYREQFGQNTELRTVAIGIGGKKFWPAIDAILDATRMDIYPFSGEKSLAVVDREPGMLPRLGRACYVGPFRFEAVEVVAQRGLRQPQHDGMRVELEIAWEPRLQPISLSQPADALSVVDRDGTPIAVASPRASFDVEVQPGSHATKLVIPLELPKRRIKKIAKFSGQLTALVPGKVAEFRFDKLASAKGVSQQRGGVTVTLDRVRRNHDLWEVHMRLRVDGPADALQSHRGWVFQNLTYLLNGQGEVVDHAGFETVLQTEREIGLAYFFDLPGDDSPAGIDNYTWVYHTPASIVRVPVEYELNDIQLP